jgi:tripartite-type tricarboxylate transporter receptor subunit TctC
MALSRRQLFRLAAGAASLPAVSRVAGAQTYPSRPVRLLVGFSAGGNNDIHARLIAQWLSERLGQQFIVENRTGAGGNLATEAVARAAPDGYTLLVASSADAWNMSLYSNLKFNFTRDITAVASISRAMNVLVVNPIIPVSSVPELIAYAKANPGKIGMASAGNGTSAHMSGEFFKMMTGVDIVHVPYRGGPPALTDLLGGQVQIMFVALASSLEHIRSGKLRALAVTGVKRSEALPDTPTVSDFVPGFEVNSWQGVGAPRNTPAEIIDKLNREINVGLADSRMNARLADLGSTAFVNSPAEFGRFIAEYTEKWGQVIKATGVKVQ